MLEVSSVAKQFGDHRILQDVSFVVNAGERVGLVGPNGCGKTTLLRILTGAEAPDQGAVMRHPSNLSIGYLEQGLIHLPDDTVGDLLCGSRAALVEAEERVERLARGLSTATGGELQSLEREYAEALQDLAELSENETSEHAARAVLAGLGLDHLDMDTRVATLSGGQKTRLGLARLLLGRPQLLLLDEPTNHLDMDALQWLEDWLRGFRGAALIVSHDRAFLNATIGAVLELDPRTHSVRRFAGNYEDWQAARASEIERQWNDYVDQQVEIARLTSAASHLRGIARFRRGGKADTNDGFAKGFFANRGLETVRRAKQIERRVHELQTDLAIEKPRSDWQIKLQFSAPPSGQSVLSIEELSAGYGAPLFQGVTLGMRAGDRVALVGPNGTGKSTLLKVIAGELPPMAGSVRLGANVRLGYSPQQQDSLDPASTPFETIRAVAAMSDTDVRSFLHYYLFAGDGVFTRVSDLSFGERARLLLARMAASGCNLLLLDEPINHLDIPSRERFEQALSEFEGTVLAVVHDRYFVQRFATRVWLLQDGTVRSFCDLDEMQRMRGKGKDPSGG